ncbi:sulfite exporter TauE/SafE family protein [Gloeocapsopsis crepidinum LEGE 06123]|uniref:Probable membrane transporter protein n=1 Tax=Gloeocapsopsis crepidinum LEGE 06123 TaxID=588587 RepID=A0ABR9UVT0_9CHRO|nr:sulfite exporter TauE/SafE family protein [Gloeocapsopsis crepidinum]MBE9192397.1 sulfite exporter TauE/SafE family protein [Gloeocapsopsis crepidinum LEGE 06123]
MSFEYWFMFPIAIAIATIALASGVEGATFFTPIFILGLGLPAEVAIGTGLMTEVFGFASGLYAYTRKGLIDYKLGVMLLSISIPTALLGTWLGRMIPADVLKGILSVGLFAIASSFLRSPEPATVKLLDKDIKSHHNAPQTCITTKAGETFCYTIGNRTEGRLLIGIGGLFLGMVSTGLGELNGYFLLQRCHVPSKVAVATSVFIVAITALIASVGHAIGFIQEGGGVLNTVLSLVIFTAPGVIIGAQLGSIVANRLPQKLLERGMGILFILVGILVLAEVAVRKTDTLASLLFSLLSLIFCEL